MTQSLPHAVIARWFFLILATAVVYLLWNIIEPYIIVLVTAAIATVIVGPLETRIRMIVKSPRVSSAIMIFLIFFAIVGPLITVGAVLAQQVNDLVSQTLANPEWRENFDPRELPIIDVLPEPVQRQIEATNPADVFDAALVWARDNVGTLFSQGAEFIFKTFLFFVCLFFFLLDRDKIYRELLALSPLRDSVDRSIVARMVETVRGVVFGALIVAVTQGIIAGIGLTIFGVPGAIIWACLVVIAAQIPLLGTAAVMVPAIAYLALTGHVYSAVGLTLWSMVAVGLVDNILSPLIVGNRTRMNALLILLSILGGLQYFGPIGFILGPTVLAAFLVIIELYKSGILQQDNHVRVTS